MKKKYVKQFHPVQGVDHGEDYSIAECPRCHSMRIHKRKGFHFLARWRCRKCHKLFFNPKWKDWAYWNYEPPKYAIWKYK
jgi:ribosomal protein L37AE/L43A